MRELVYYVAVSLDGFIAAPDHTFDAFPVTGDHMDTIMKDYTDALPGPALAALGLTAPLTRFDTVLMGWNTYAVGLAQGLDNPYPHLRQYVFSRTQTAVPAAVTTSAEDPAAVVRELKAGPDGADIWLCGGGQLASALAGEIDRLVLKVNPVTFGAGIPLFAGHGYTPRNAELANSKRFDSGVVINDYRLN
ncbi:dihydrofolate reductase family protein [Arthrobacter sp. EPSL27]|uniref:dihydrofolate reductase family protein n=1 Tax=Arthrobacter sp. EPSL27 TaxID=1745378 RepID=UPI0007490014|nr:dihydrofolate reductase family protein [Arthrobacter sp. EPSL27]KUM37709.1 riboflavin biosynthesis protein RibD [Arthrobacter sp. EPSL27]